MNILNKWKTIILIFLVIILLLYNISISSKYKKYIEEDKEQFIKEINNLIIKSKGKIDNIISNKDETNLQYEDIELLMMYHEDLERNIVGFKKKSNFINKNISEEFQKIWDKYNYDEEINFRDTFIYYRDFLKRIEYKDDIMLNDDDINMLNGIYNLYKEIRNDITGEINFYNLSVKGYN